MYENEIKTSYEDQRETAMKAERNKTIDMTLEEGQKYLKRCMD